MNNLQVLGTKEINGKEIKVIEGGFGEGQKTMLSKDIARLHDVETKHINELISRNIQRFNSNDLINLCDDNFRVAATDLGLITSNGQKHCYILSERGYTKLVAAMSNNNEKKWEIMDQIIDEYFQIREIIKTGNTQADLFTQLMTASMTAISQVLNENMAQLRQDIQYEFKQEKDKMKTIITEQEIVHGNQLQEARNLIGFKTKNTASLTKLLKAKLSQIKGYKVMASDYHYIMAKERLFKKYVVWNWEEIPTYKYDEIHADIDSIEDLDSIYF